LGNRGRGEAAEEEAAGTKVAEVTSECNGITV